MNKLEVLPNIEWSVVSGICPRTKSTHVTLRGDSSCGITECIIMAITYRCGGSFVSFVLYRSSPHLSEATKTIVAFD